MNRSQIRTLLKDELGTPLPGVVRDDDSATEDSNLNRYINHALRKVAIDTGGYVKSETITLVTDQRLYDPPAGLMLIDHIRLVLSADNEEPLEHVRNLADLPDDYRDTTGEPDRWYEEGGQIGFYYIPSSGYNGTTVRVYGVFEPPDLSADSDSPKLPVATHRAIAILAAAMILEAQADAEAMSSRPDFAADSVQQESRTRNYSQRAQEKYRKYREELGRATGPVFA